MNKDKEYIAVSLGEDVFKLAHLKVTAHTCSLIDVVKKDIRQVTEEDLPGTILSACAGMNVKKLRALFIVPPHIVTTKNIEIPSLDPAEIKSIIDLQAGRHTPYAREEILVGYVTIGIFQRNYTKVLLVIVNREVIKKHLTVLQAAGLKIEKVLFAPEGMAGFYAQALNVKEEDTPVGLIDVAYSHTNFIVEFNRTVATYRHIGSGMTHLIKEGAAAQEKILSEIIKSVEAYQNEDIHKMPETYYLTSDDAKIKELQPILQEKLKANVKIMPYLDHIQASQPTLLKIVSEFNDDSFLDTIAATATVDLVQVDLTPDEIKVQKSIEEKGRQVVTAGLFTIVFLVLICGIFLSKVYFRSLYLNKLKEEYTEKRKNVLALERLDKKTRIIKDYLNSRMVSLEVLRELYTLIPDEIYVQNVIMDQNGTIDLQGISESTSRIFEFNKALEDSKLFKGVKTKSTTAKKDRGKDVSAFELAFKLESAKDDPVEEPAKVDAAAPKATK